MNLRLVPCKKNSHVQVGGKPCVAMYTVFCERPCRRTRVGWVEVYEDRPDSLKFRRLGGEAVVSIGFLGDTPRELARRIRGYYALEALA